MMIILKLMLLSIFAFVANDSDDPIASQSEIINVLDRSLIVCADYDAMLRMY